MDPAHVLDTIAEHRVTFAFFVPSVLRLLVSSAMWSSAGISWPLRLRLEERRSMYSWPGECQTSKSTAHGHLERLRAGRGHRVLHVLPA